MKTYVGHRLTTHDTSIVYVKDALSNVPLTIHTQAGAAYPKSPDGHAWGYGGSGPSQLALDHLGEEPAAACFQEFKRKFIEPVQGPDLCITADQIQGFLRAYAGPIFVREWSKW